jgi:hypothetical protein
MQNQLLELDRLRREARGKRVPSVAYQDLLWQWADVVESLKSSGAWPINRND